jgi:GMP synthase (glutamine-hydrolysing)
MNADAQDHSTDAVLQKTKDWTGVNTVAVLRHVRHETLGSLEALIRQAGLDIECVDLFGPPRRFHPWHHLGLVVLGGPMNVDQTDEYPFLAAEVEWIRAALAGQTPVLGICLGSQLLAKAAGARVYPNSVKEIGWYPLELTEAAAHDPLFAGCPAGATVFQWHGDTFDLPPSATHLAESAACRHQAFRVGDRAWGLQFHLEVTAEMIETWLTEPGNCGELAGLDYIDPNRIRAQTPRFMPELSRIAEIVFRPFVELCQATKREVGE